MTYSGLGSLANDFSVMCSWEGDNHVMMLQCGRALAKQAAEFATELLPKIPSRYTVAAPQVDGKSSATELLSAGLASLLKAYQS